MSITTDKEIVSWAHSNMDMLKVEHEKFTRITNIYVPFDTFCKQAYWQMPYTADQR